MKIKSNVGKKEEDSYKSSRIKNKSKKDKELLKIKEKKRNLSNKERNSMSQLAGGRS